jgi:nicotinamidase-related amidase
MTRLTYDKATTALLFVDPYNDFLSEGGKIWSRVKDVAIEVGLLDNLRAISSAVRRADIQIFIVPHRRWEPGDYETWRHPSPTQLSIMKRHSFARGEWGGDWHPDFAPRDGDIIIKEHWSSSGFANTDLDLQLKQHSISQSLSLDCWPTPVPRQPRVMRRSLDTMSRWFETRRQPSARR